MMPVRLRGHHFLCILTYRGFGYSQPFVANMSALVAEIAAGRPVILTEGPDDICNGLTADCRLACDHDCSLSETRDLDRLAVEAVTPLIGLEPGTGLLLDRARIATLRGAFAAGSIRKACARCPWSDFCDTIAEEGFSATRLFPPGADASAAK